MKKKSTEKGPAVQCGVKMMENSICAMEIYGSHQTILHEDLKMWNKFVPKLPKETQKEKCCLQFPTFFHM